MVSDAIVLKCELSRANGVVRWYKDDERIMGNDHFIFEEEGTFRSLIILNAEIRDAGKYTCDSSDDKIVFSVTVEGEMRHFLHISYNLVISSVSSSAGDPDGGYNSPLISSYLHVFKCGELRIIFNHCNK